MGLTKRTEAERSRRAEAVGACRLPLRLPLRLPTRRDVLEYIPSLLPSVLLSLALFLSIAVSPSPFLRLLLLVARPIFPSVFHRPARFARESKLKRALCPFSLSTDPLSFFPLFLRLSRLLSRPTPRVYSISPFFLSLLNNARYSTSERTPSRPR